MSSTIAGKAPADYARRLGGIEASKQAAGSHFHDGMSGMADNRARILKSLRRDLPNLKMPNNNGVKASILHVGFGPWAMSGYLPALNKYANKAQKDDVIEPHAGVIVVGLREGADAKEKIQDIRHQGGVYTLKQHPYQSDKAIKTKVIDIIRGAIHAPTEGALLDEAAASKAIKTVSISIGAGRYGENIGKFLRKVAESRIRAEKENGETEGERGFSIVALENDEKSGALVEAALKKADDGANPMLTRWIQRNVSIHSTMIDCISKNHDGLAVGGEQLPGVQGERYRKIVVEEKDKKAFPQFDENLMAKVGLSSVTPENFPRERELKATFVNLRHVLDALIGAPKGLKTVDQAEDNQKIVALIGHFYDNLFKPALREKYAGVSSAYLDRYQDDAHLRFLNNKAMGDELERVGRNATGKIYQICGKTGYEFASRNRMAAVYAGVLSAMHARFLTKATDDGQSYKLTEDNVSAHHQTALAAGEITPNELVKIDGKGNAVGSFAQLSSSIIDHFSAARSMLGKTDGLDAIVGYLRENASLKTA